MAKFTDKLSNLISQQAPDFVLADHPYFLEFIKAYYTFLESAELSLTNIGDSDTINLETETATINDLLLNGTNQQSDDKGDRILLEDTSYGDFINGEIITGQTSGATATVLVEDIDDNSRLFITAENKFIEGELIIGSTSLAEATILTYRANPVQNIQELLDYPDPDKTIQGFLTKFRNAFLQSIPDGLYEDVDKRKLIKNINSLYRAKGTKRASEIFFKLLFNESAEISYPKEKILRISDGQWDSRKIIRAVEVGTSDAQYLIGQKITQANDTASATVNEATAIVESIFKFTISGVTIVELVLVSDSVVGTFITGENITGTNNANEDNLITCTMTGIINSKIITNDGTLYNTSDSIVLTTGGTDAIMQVGDIGSGSIDEIFIDGGGSGYAIGDVINFSIGNATAKIAVVNGGLRLETGTEANSTSHIVLEDETVRGDPYTGDKVVQESGTGTEDITDIRIIYNGNGYTSLPALTITSSGGSSASLLAYGPEIGRVLSLKIIEFGRDYQLSPSPPTLTLPTYLLITGITGSFLPNQTVSATGSDGSTAVTATIVSFNNNTNILKLSSASGIFGTGVTVTGSGGATATIKRFDQSTATSTVGALTTTDGAFISQKGWISEDTMKVQDSLLYQDYSYIIKVGTSIIEWRDAYTRTLHPSGFYYVGEVAVQSSINAQLRTITGVNSGTTAIIRSVLKTIFMTILGRRLGTEDDGTSLRANAELGVSVDLDTSTVEHFPANTRDVTLTRPSISFDYVSRVRRVLNDINVKQGFVYAGPRLGTLNKYANTAFGTTSPASGITFAILNDIKITGTNSSLNGSSAIFIGTSTEGGQLLKTDFTIPAEITTAAYP